MDANRYKIINLFQENVLGKKFNSKDFNEAHDGKEGHWLEHQMGIKPNSDNSADLYGYEMKKHTTSKTTFGDWSPDISLWGKNKPYEEIGKLNRDEEFLVFFGKPNKKKGNRYSWSGEPAPKINIYNNFGQILGVDEDKNICAKYSYSKDMRSNKDQILPQQFRREDFILAKWSKEKIKKNLEKKFNQLGWFKCYKNKSGVYYKISFGLPINYDTWINLVEDGIVFFDSGMYAGNKRPYSQWRANNTFWESIVVKTSEGNLDSVTKKMTALTEA